MLTSAVLSIEFLFRNKPSRGDFLLNIHIQWAYNYSKFSGLDGDRYRAWITLAYAQNYNSNSEIFTKHQNNVNAFISKNQNDYGSTTLAILSVAYAYMGVDRGSEKVIKNLHKEAQDITQASIARIVNSMEEKEKTVPMLSSPRLAMERLSKVIGYKG